MAGAAPSGGAAYQPPVPPAGSAYPPPQGGYPPPQGGYPPPQGGYPPQPASAGLADNMAAMLCYVGWFITGIIFLVIEPYNKRPNIRFHAFQSIFTSLALIVFQIVFSIVIGILMRIAGMFGLFGILGLFIPLLWLGLWLYLVISAYQGKTVVLPIIGPIAQAQAGK